MPVPRTTVSLRKASKWPGKRAQENRAAYELFLRAHGKEVAHLFPTPKEFLHETPDPNEPAYVQGSWYGRLFRDNRYWIRSNNETVGVIGYATQWVHKPEGRIITTKWRYRVRRPVNKILPRSKAPGAKATDPPTPEKRFQNAVWRWLRRRYETAYGLKQSKTLPETNKLIRIAEIGIVIDPNNQRQGIGSQAIEQVCEILKKKGFEFVYFDTENPQLISFARNRGWEEIPFTITGISLKGRPGDFRYFIKKL